MATITRSKKGQSQHYSTDSALAATFGVDHLTSLGAMETLAPFTVDADGWNNWKNVFFLGDGTDTTAAKLTDFVHVDIDDSANTQGRNFTVENAKRGNILLGDGDDTLDLSLATNNTGWSNTFYIDAGAGKDVVTITSGEAQTGSEDTTKAKITDGRHTTTEAHLGAGDDHFENTTLSDDTVSGGAGNDEIHGGGGDDLLFGDRSGGGASASDGNDVIDGGDGNDTIGGQGGDDQIDGGGDDDRLFGSKGDDTIHGGDGDDFIRGNQDDDELTGGAGADTFDFTKNDGVDVITDFELGADLIGVAAFGFSSTSDFTISEGGGDSVIDLGGGQQVTVAGVTGLTDADFIFA